MLEIADAIPQLECSRSLQAPSPPVVAKALPSHYLQRISFRSYRKSALLPGLKKEVYIQAFEEMFVSFVKSKVRI